MNADIVKKAVLHAAATALYIIAIASAFFNGSKIFGPNMAGNVLIPIGMLCLLVFSAALTGFLIFGRPVLWYLDGKKKEALSLLGWTLGVFCVITAIIFFALFLVSRG
jgi:hypothetical protein